MKESYQIVIPEEVINKLALEERESLELRIVQEQMVIRKSGISLEGQKISLRWFLIPSILSVLVFFLYFIFQKQSQIALTGDTSIATVSIVLSFISGILSFSLCFIRIKQAKIQSTAKDIYWRHFPSILVSFSVITLYALFFFFKVLGAIFYGASFDLYTSSAIFFVVNASVNYLLINLALALNLMLLTNLMVFVIIGGVFGSMMTNNDKLWWQHNFSFLGTVEAKASWQFNVTLILSAVLMIALVDFIFVHLAKKYPTKQVTILRILLILVALNLGGVGAFPYKEASLSAVIHNQVAANLVYLIIILILTIRWLLPVISKEFQLVSYLIMGMLVASVILFQGVHYLSLTAFELFSFILAFAWLLLLFQYLQKLVLEEPVDYIVSIVKNKD